MNNMKTETPPTPQILIVDDIPANLRLLSDMLRASGYQVRAAGSGTMALRSIAVELPDLILLDARMPEMDGFEVCRRLKADEKFKQIPVIFLSALNDTADKVEAFNAGAIDYITKPFEPTEVLTRIRNHLQLYNLQKKMEQLVEQKTAELQQANLLLQANEKKYKMLFDHNVAAMLLTEADTGITICNQEFEKLCGFSRKEVEGGMSWKSFIASEEDMLKMTEYQRKRVNRISGPPRSYEFKFKTKNGEIKDIYNSVVYLEETNQLLAMMIDITDRRKAQEATENALREKVLLLREVDHRIKNNLQIIISLLSLKKELCRDPAALDILTDIENRMRSMSILHEMLSVRDEANVVNMKDYISQIIAIVKSSYDTDAKKIRFLTDIPSIEILSFQAVLCGLLVNETITNAVKHAFVGKTEGTISLRMTIDNGDRIILAIRDDGIGITDSVDKSGNTTIGMALIENLVYQLKGEIDISAASGTTITISFIVI